MLERTRCMVDFRTMMVIGETGQTAYLQRNPDASEVPEHCIVVKLKGFKTCIDNAFTNLTDRLQKGDRTVHIPCPPVNPDIVEPVRQQISNYCRQFCIKFQFTEDGGLGVKGAEGYVDQICPLLRDFLQIIPSRFPAVIQQAPMPPVTQQPQSVLQHSLQSDTPPLWQPQSEKCVFNPVIPQSPEWNEIVGLMKRTMPTVRVEKIDRVQNRPVWEKYSLEGRQMLERNHGDIKEKLLFHGTSRTDPYTVAKSDSGIDFRYSSKERSLMWGSGAYFAVKACYSDRFSYPTRNYRQIMLVSVLTGRSYGYGKETRRDLTKPPQYSSNGTLYDTVYGESADSGIYVVYDHCKSCPAYIITYTK